MSSGMELKKVIDCVEFCMNHEQCEGCPSGNSIDDCKIDNEVLDYLHKMQFLLKGYDPFKE